MPNINLLTAAVTEFAAYDPKLYELIGRVFESHRIPMDVFHGKRIRPVSCPTDNTEVPATDNTDNTDHMEGGLLRHRRGGRSHSASAALCASLRPPRLRSFR